MFMEGHLFIWIYRFENRRKLLTFAALFKNVRVMGN